MIEMADNYAVSFYARGNYWSVTIFGWDSKILLDFNSHSENGQHRLDMLIKHGFKGFAY